MSSVVDYFVIVESRVTFQGAPKTLYFEDAKTRFAAWADQIIHIVVGDDPLPPHEGLAEWWGREHYQRNQIARGLTAAAPGDIVMVSDADEIARADVLRVVIDGFRPGRVYLLKLGLYHFSLNRRDAGVVWDGHRLLAFKDFRSGQASRRIKSTASKRWGRLGLGWLGVRHRNWLHAGLFKRAIDVSDAGWHFSSVGGHDNWRRKIESYSHPELKQWPAYQSMEAFDAWVASLALEPIASMPACVRQTPRFRALLAPDARNQPDDPR